MSGGEVQRPVGVAAITCQTRELCSDPGKVRGFELPRVHRRVFTQTCAQLISCIVEAETYVLLS